MSIHPSEPSLSLYTSGAGGSYSGVRGKWNYLELFTVYLNDVSRRRIQWGNRSEMNSRQTMRVNLSRLYRRMPKQRSHGIEFLPLR